MERCSQSCKRFPSVRSVNQVYEGTAGDLALPRQKQSPRCDQVIRACEVAEELGNADSVSLGGFADKMRTVVVSRIMSRGFMPRTGLITEGGKRGGVWIRRGSEWLSSSAKCPRSKVRYLVGTRVSRWRSRHVMREAGWNTGKHELQIAE
jgi:hypothetical protein